MAAEAGKNEKVQKTFSQMEKMDAVVTEGIVLHKTQGCVSALLDQSFLAAKIIPGFLHSIAEFNTSKRSMLLIGDDFMFNHALA